MRNFIGMLLTIFTILACVDCPLRGDNYFVRPESIVATPAKTSGSYTEDTQLIERIIRAYRKNTNEQIYAHSSMWGDFFHKININIHQKLLFGQFHEIAEILRNPGKTDLFYGFDMLVASLAHTIQSPENSLNHAKVCLEGLILCAEAFCRHPPVDNLEDHSSNTTSGGYSYPGH